MDPCSSSDVLTHLPSMSWGKRNLGLIDVGFLCWIPKWKSRVLYVAEWPCCHDRLRFSSLSFRFVSLPPIQLYFHLSLKVVCASVLEKSTKCCEFNSPSRMSWHSLTRARRLFFKCPMHSFQKVNYDLSGLSCKTMASQLEFFCVAKYGSRA